MIKSGVLCFTNYNYYSQCFKDSGQAGPKQILTDFKHDIEGKPSGPTLILLVSDRGPALKAMTVDL